MTDVRILIVGGDIVEPVDLRACLEKLGYQGIALVDSEDEAIREALVSRPDLILMNKNQGAEENSGVVEPIWARLDIPVVLVGIPDEHFLKQNGQGLLFGFIHCPINDRELASQVEISLARFRAERELRLSEERYRQAVIGSANGIWDWNFLENTFYLSPRGAEILGYEAGEIEGTPDQWFDRIYPADLDEVKMHFSAHLDNITDRISIEHRMVNKDGTARWVLSQGQALRDRNGAPIRISGSLMDIHHRKLLEEQLTFDAFHDILTGLPNRSLLLERVGRMIERNKRNPEKYAVLFLDVDRFKVVNDTLGQKIGDQVLAAIGERLSKNVRSCDTVARLGGDEFAILLENFKEVDDVRMIAERTMNHISQSFTIEDRVIYLTGSIGIALGKPDYTQPVDVLRDADTAMHQAKFLGKGRCEFFETDFRFRMVTRTEMERQLRNALVHNEIELVFQPIFSMRDGHIVGFEALARWYPKNRSPISPARFIPVAEQTGMINPIGEHILTQSCFQLKKWHKSFPRSEPFTMSVNISGGQLIKPGFVQDVRRILTEIELAPCYLRFELTETIFLQNNPVAQAVIKDLVRLGIHIDLDDFGSGYASLNYMQQFPIRLIKIDRDFLKQLQVKDRSDEMIKLIIRLSQEQGVDTVAEGVETKDQLQLLQKINCTMGQGYLYSPPIREDQIKALLEKENDLKKSLFEGVKIIF